jgi:hypothetical protein
MNIATDLDMERLREVMTALGNGGAPLRRDRGIKGDGVIALFGAPVALEDAAFRGCLAAPAIQEEVSRLAARWLVATVWICGCAWG